VEGLAAEMIKYDVKPEIEVFDAAMLYSAANLVNKGLLKTPVHLQFVLGIPNALPARRQLLEFLIAEAREILPDATWTAAGIGRHQFEVNKWSLELGGHCRTGLEDNIKIAPDRLAASNAELVKRIVDIADDYSRRPASPTEARGILGIETASAAT
jgi:uncharacterized protein (DUF849 family)